MRDKQNGTILAAFEWRDVNNVNKSVVKIYMQIGKQFKTKPC